MKRIHPDKNYSSLSKQIIKILDAWSAAVVPRNITQSFKSAGLESYLENGTMYYQVNIFNAIKLRGIDLNMADSQIEKHTPRRRVLI